MDRTINLGDEQKKESKVFSGRNNGSSLRRRLRLDDYDKEDGIATVTIPPETFSFNISFFLGLFSDSVRTLGETVFRQKYVFQCTDVIMDNINDGIERAQKVSEPLF